METNKERRERIHQEQTALMIAQRAIDRAAQKEAWWAEFTRRQNDPQPETD